MAGLIVVAVNRMPAADVEVSADLVRRLLADQHPDLARLLGGVPRERLGQRSSTGSGMGSSRGCRSAPGCGEIIKNEQRWLPGLAAGCPCRAVPIRNGPGSPHKVAPIHGAWCPTCRSGAAARGQFLRPGGSRGAIGEFLGALHVPAPGGRAAGQPVPWRPAGRARTGGFAANLALLTAVKPAKISLSRDAVLRVQDAALAASGYDGQPFWLHGDLHPANILVNDGQVSGVIDFDDITAADPACDLSVAWMLLPARLSASASGWLTRR